MASKELKKKKKAIPRDGGKKHVNRGEKRRVEKQRGIAKKKKTSHERLPPKERKQRNSRRRGAGKPWRGGERKLEKPRQRAGTFYEQKN